MMIIRHNHVISRAFSMFERHFLFVWRFFILVNITTVTVDGSLMQKSLVSAKTFRPDLRLRPGWGFLFSQSWCGVMMCGSCEEVTCLTALSSLVAKYLIKRREVICISLTERMRFHFVCINFPLHSRFLDQILNYIVIEITNSI